MRRATSESARRVLLEAAWQNEKRLALIRVAIWAAVAPSMRIIFPEAHATHVLMFAALGVSLAGAWALRSAYRTWIPAVVTLIDFASVGASIAAAGDSIARTAGPIVATHVLYGGILGPCFLMIGINVLRTRPGMGTWAALVGCATYVVVLEPRGLVDGSSFVDFLLLLTLGAIVDFSLMTTNGILEKVRQRDALARFLPSRVVDRISADPDALALGGVEEEATVLFADIRNFTSLSAKMDAPAVVAMLNEYFGEMVDEVFRCEGILDKFIGDGLCAVFGPPIASDDRARHALRCGLGMLARLDSLNTTRVARGEPALAIGIGIHSGKLVAGNVGSPARMEFTHIGDTVNVASRIEGLTKDANEPLLASEETFSRAGGATAVEARALPPMLVKGKDEPMRVYAVRSVGSTSPGRPAP